MGVKIFKLKSNEAIVFKIWATMYTRCTSNLPLIVTENGLISSIFVNQDSNGITKEMMMRLEIKKQETSMYINKDILEDGMFSFSIDSKKFKECVASVKQKDHINMKLEIDTRKETMMLKIIIKNEGGEIIKDTEINAAIPDNIDDIPPPDYGDTVPVTSITTSKFKSAFKGMTKSGRACSFISTSKGINFKIEEGGVKTNIPFGSYKDKDEIIYNIDFGTAFLSKISDMAGFTKGDIKVYVLEFYPLKLKCAAGSIGEFACYITEK